MIYDKEKMNIIKISEKTENCALLEVKDALDLAIESNKNYEFDKAVVILAKHRVKANGDEEIALDISFGGVGINDVFIIGLLDIVKSHVMSELDFIPAIKKDDTIPTNIK